MTTRRKLPGSRPTNRCGFTLVEMLVAVGLGAIILAVVVTAFSQSSTVSTVAHAKTEAMHNARVAMDLLERDISSAYIEPAGQIFDGDGTHLHLRTVSRTDGPGAQEVYYKLEQRDVGGVRNVQCLVRGHVDPGGNPKDTTYPVGHVVRIFSLRYYSDQAGQWFPSWDSRSANVYQNRKMPDVVEVTLEVVDLDDVLASEDNNPFIIRRLISPPSGS